MNTSRRRRLRQIAHHLDPVVIVAARGVTDSVVAETDRALTDHELIKVRIADGERDDRRTALDDLAVRTGADVVQTIGRIGVLYRANPEARHSVVQAAGG